MARNRRRSGGSVDPALIFDTGREVIEDRVQYLIVQCGLSRSKAEKQATQEWREGALRNSTFGS